MTIYAVPDVHGMADALDAAHELIASDRAREGVADAPVVHLGDLNDRGPDTRGVLDRITTGRARGEPWIVLMGNHDAMFLDFVLQGRADDPTRRDGTWLHPSLGAAATLRSYGVDPYGRRLDEVQRAAAAAVPEAHVELLSGCPLWHEAGPLLFVHAGIRPGIPLEEQDPEDLIWIREGFLDDPRPHPWLVVHGHTPVPRPTHYGNRIDLDAGAVFGGPLVAAVFEGRDCWILGPEGRRPLRP